MYVLSEEEFNKKTGHARREEEPMPSHYKDKKGAARAKALKEHKDAVKKDKKKKT